MKIQIIRLVTTAFVLFATTTAMLAATFTVTTTVDNGDNATPTSGSLRAAIIASNASVGVTDLIDFDIAGAGLHTISPPSALPAITDPVVIDGYVDHGDGASKNTNPVGQGLNTVLTIELDGTSAGAGVSGLTLTAGNNTIRGLVINRFTSTGIAVNSATNLIEGNFIGTNVAGTAALGNGSQGIRVDSKSDNTIGGTTPAARNLISGNNEGIEIRGAGADRTIVRGNLIGTNAAGTGALGNVTNGVRIPDGIGNIVGGTASGARNVISGNGEIGVAINSSDPTGTLVQGNFIGTEVTGTADLGNTLDGVKINGASNNTIGGTASGAGNVISGNDGDGVWILGSGSTGNLVQGNYIGTDVTGTLDLGNTFNGTRIQDAPTNTIGGTVSGARNIISGNDENGSSIIGASATGNLVQGNFIGTDVNGTADLGNIENGVVLYNAPNNKIGGGNAGEGNVISGNGGNGVYISGATAQNNTISQNLIGRNAANTGALGNGGHGVFLTSSGPNTIGGGFNPNNANTIAHNGGDGVAIVFGTGPCIKKGIVSNSIFSNGGLGIDLEDDGVTLNDVGDADTGANTLQNFPVLTSASTSGGNTTINGSLNSTASTSFHIEFFASAAADPTGYGEGQTFLGYLDVMTDSGGNVPFSAVLPVLPPAGQTIISATTTDNVELANTSEFSKVVQLAGTAGRLQNISTRAHVQTGDNVLIGGLIITGVDQKKVIFRAIGPSLEANGSPLAGKLENPILELHNSSGALIAFNDDWGDAPEPERTEIENSPLKPTNSLESAIIRTLDPGTYTAIVVGKNSTTGIALVDAYDSSPASNSRFTNLSSRAFVETGDNIMIGGVIVGGGGGGSVRVIVRGLGPSLMANGLPLPGRMADPTLKLVNEDGDVLIENDNWQTSQQSEIQATGLAPSNNLESAIVTILPPGGTTALLQDKNDTSGIALVEIYELASP